jgi:uncharacterized membrane-anchored protein
MSARFVYLSCVNQREFLARRGLLPLHAAASVCSSQFRGMSMFRTILLASCLALAPLYAVAQQPAPETAPAAPAAPAPAGAADSEAAAAAEEAAAFAAAREEFEKSLNHRTGQVDIAKGAVGLNVPTGFYYLDRTDARKVLEDAWGNPPDAAIEGMLFKDGVSALDPDSWGVVLTYDDSGYVSDEDAAKINFDELLRTMQEGQQEMNPQLIRQNYPPITLVGWATKPHYDAAAHKVYWAKDLIFGSDSAHTLNYSARVLGRKGVLELNFVASMDALPAIEAVSPEVLAIPQFKEGFRYEDFDAKTDKKADYGIAGLIAGGAAGGLLLAKKTGLLAVALVFLKKFGVFLLVGAGGLIAAVARMFGGKKAATATAGGERSPSSLDAQLFPDPPAQSGSNQSGGGPAA